MMYQMRDFTLREYTQEEYESDVREKLKSKGLYESIEELCNEINDEVKGLSYIKHRDIQEALCDILNTVKIYQSDLKDLADKVR